MIYADEEDDFVRCYEECKEMFVEFPVFLAYIEERRACKEKKALWAKSWRQDAEFNTNNLIESYHNKLKTFYLGRSRNHRVDRVIYMLTKIVTLDYRRDEAQFLFGFKPAHLSQFEQDRKKTADRVPIEKACRMIEDTDDKKVVLCQSFNDENVKYSLIIDNRCVKSCSCPVTQLHICKHMFLVSRVRSVAFSERRSIAEAASGGGSAAESSGNFASEATDVSLEGVNTAHLIPDIKKSINNTVSLLLRKINDFDRNNNPEDLEGLENKEKTLKLLLSNTENTLNHPNQRPNKQR